MAVVFTRLEYTHFFEIAEAGKLLGVSFIFLPLCHGTDTFSGNDKSTLRVGESSTS
jgi:hypothetical protein